MPLWPSTKYWKEAVAPETFSLKLPTFETVRRFGSYGTPTQGEPLVRNTGPSYVANSVHDPAGITNHVARPELSYENHTRKSCACCWMMAMPQPFCFAPPHHMSVRPFSVGVATLPNAWRVMALVPERPLIVYVSVALESLAKVIVTVPTGLPTMNAVASYSK